ncbi:MAG TPA: hypothetical protein VH589_14745 [Trebonia sp.]|jgi:hypothetical protein
MTDYTSDYSTEPEAGGVGTLQRPAAPRVPARRTTRPRPERLTGNRAGGVLLAPRTISRPQRAAGEVAPQGGRRMPFIVLLCGLLGGALISALVISTTLAAGSYQITRLQQTTDALARQRQMLQEQVAQAQSAQVIQQRAEQLGMREAGQLRFLNLKTGKVQADAGSKAEQSVNVPGYAP